MPSLSGLTGKIEDKGDWAIYALSAYEAIPSNAIYAGKGLSGDLHYFLDTKTGALNEIKNTLDLTPGKFVANDSLLVYKLKSGHIYAWAIKGGALLWLANEFGFLTKYKPWVGKALKAGLFGLFTLPGSGPYGENPDMSRGGNPNVNPNIPTGYGQRDPRSPYQYKR
jgi:hypothetical protein